jgi:uncharacterized protein YndB with AHSA1/START domain
MTDRIEKTVVLRAPLERVWRAIGDSQQFGQWFGARFEGPFVAGQPLKGKIVPTSMDAEIAQLQKPHEGTPFEVVVVRVDPPHHLSFKWHPYAKDVNTAHEPMTLVAFDLEPHADGVLLTITESGFDGIPLDRRAAAFKANEGGWTMQARLIERYVAQTGKA